MATPPLSPALLWRMTRPAFLLLTVAACLLGTATAAAGGHGINGWLAAATTLLAVLAHAAGNVLNDLHDARNGADAANTQGITPFTGGSRLIQTGAVTEGQTAALAWALLLALVPAGLLLAAQTAAGVLLLGMVGLLLAWAYSAPPLRLMARGLGELAVALAWFLVVLGSDYVQRHQFFVTPASAALSLALLVAALLLINGCPDVAADAAVGKRTLAVRLGPEGAAWAYLGLVLAAHGWLAVSVGLRLAPGAALWGLLALPLSLAAAALLLRHAHQPRRLKPALALTVAATLLHGLGMAAGFGWVALRH